MKTEQLILYRDFEEGDLLTDMVWLAENYADDFYNLSDKAGLLYDCIKTCTNFNFYFFKIIS